MGNILPHGNDKFLWPKGCPRDESDFEELMWAIDTYLDKRDFDPIQRYSMFSGYFLQASLWRGGSKYPPKVLADQNGYEGDVLVAKAYRWYKEVYGNRLITRHTVTSVPIKIGNAIWRIELPRTFGVGDVHGFIDRDLNNFGVDSDGCPLQGKGPIASGYKINLLPYVKDLSQGMATRMSDEQRSTLAKWLPTAIIGISWVISLFLMVDYGDDGLFYTAFRDYESSVDSLLCQRLSQSRWDVSQSVEKIIKGLLRIDEKPLNYNHNLRKLAQDLGGSLSTQIDEKLLDQAYWPANGRYAEKSTTLVESLCANHAALEIAKHLAEDEGVKAIIDRRRSHQKS